MTTTIYAPQGLAAENCDLAMNTMDGCIHGCLYCYVPLVRHITREKFHAGTRPRIRTEDIEKEAAKLKGNNRPVQLCFTTDPYQDDDVCCGLTRAAIYILHLYGHSVSILTKGGVRAQHDLDLLRPGDSFGVTLTTLDSDKYSVWEPGAGSPEWRIKNLMEAKKAGLDTYVSLEPVLYPQDTFNIVQSTAGFVDHYKVGPLNYRHAGMPTVPEYDHRKFVTDIINLVAVKFKRGIHVKTSFAASCGSAQGYRVGEQLP